MKSPLPHSPILPFSHSHPRRAGANVWVLAALGALLLAIGFDAVRGMLTGAPPPKVQLPAPPPEPVDPDFRVGDLAPDFELPDRSGKKHKLSELVRGDTLLFFSCACDACRRLEGYAAILAERMGSKAPAVLSVNTMPKEQEEAWVRDTGLKQTFLYEQKNGPIMEQYRGHPCPRGYRLSGDRRVRWISPSLKGTHYLEKLGNSMAVELGFPPEGDVPDERGRPVR